jgi:hypothetical protein
MNKMRENNMTENNTNTDTNKYLFINLVTMLGIMAMQQLGKLVNPVAGKAAINLEAAQATIDTLDMLAVKTEGRLDNDEARLLKDTLATLKMNYVETRDEEDVKKAQRGKGTEAQSDGEKQSKTDSQEQKKSETNPEPEQNKDPKFHKSYGE